MQHRLWQCREAALVRGLAGDRGDPSLMACPVTGSLFFSVPWLHSGGNCAVLVCKGTRRRNAGSIGRVSGITVKGTCKMLWTRGKMARVQQDTADGPLFPSLVPVKVHVWREDGDRGSLCSHWRSRTLVSARASGPR